MSFSDLGGKRIDRALTEIFNRRIILQVMKQFTAMIHSGEPDEGGFWATCLEVPGANGQGGTREECLANLASAVRDLLDLNRAEAMSDDPHAEEAALLVP